MVSREENHQGQIPKALQRIFFHDEAGRWLRWHTDKLWALPTPATALEADGLWWHLDLPVWPSAPPSKIFDVTPTEVLAAPDAHPEHWQRIANADLSYPLELFESFGKWVIMDGYHRLARHYLERSKVIRVRRHDQALLQAILRSR